MFITVYHLRITIILLIHKRMEIGFAIVIVNYVFTKKVLLRILKILQIKYSLLSLGMFSRKSNEKNRIQRKETLKNS